MSYSKEQIEKTSLDVIAEHKLIFINEIIPYIPISRATFYSWEMDKLDTIKDAIDGNKVNRKVGLRKRWYEAENPTTDAMLYKLCGTEEEQRILSNNQINNNISANSKGDITVVFDEKELKADSFENEKNER